jgi:hypothetical protein
LDHLTKLRFLLNPLQSVHSFDYPSRSLGYKMKVVAQASRLVPYWLTFVVVYWCNGFNFAWNSSKAYDKINNGMVVPVRNEMTAQQIRLLSPF